MADQTVSRRLPVKSDTDYQVSSSARHTCRLCAHGCKNYDVMLTETEAHRLSLNVWRDLLEDVPDNLPLVVLDSTTQQYRLNKRNGSCVFLGSDNLCIIHKESGLRTKPLACQFFPFQAVQAPDGVHVSLNTGCRRLVEMGDSDAPLDANEAIHLLAGIQAISTIGDELPLTPMISASYADFITWQNRLLDTLIKPQASYWQNLHDAARLLLTIPADPPVEGVTWQTLFIALQTLINHIPERQNIATLFERAQAWLPALTTPNMILNGGFDTPETALFFRSMARQYLEGRQVALHRSALSGWTALLATLVAGLLGTAYLLTQSASRQADHTLNSVLSDALDLFFIPTGQIALTEPNQQAFLLALATLPEALS